MLCGGTSDTKPATAETQDLVDQVKHELEEKENKKFPVFKATSFKSQVVAGTNYFVKVHVGGEEFIHVRLFQSLPHENKPVALHGYQTDKTKHDELTYF
ncbi:cystatin-B [Tupaia chinensis]|uniref:Cystatin-B n=1 Tax=Tupaia chinensis TaxID=246437 RepID=L8Y1T1_TUPCH|nr:cystatin-B [Tupaia chinensis]ELV10333.1 Cystatin-B [Tupaia chinensis]